MSLRDELAEIIGIDIYNYNRNIEYKVLESVPEHGYVRQRIEYDSFGDWVPAFLLLPEKLDNNPAILINHQHNRERHLGKSEVCGLAGNPLQAFGPELARRGFVVLAPDTICFEDRRKNAKGIEPLKDDLLSCVAPRKLLIVSAEDDKYSKDAPYIVEKISETYAKYNAINNLRHIRYEGGHALTQERFDAIINWILENGKSI